MRLTVFYCVFLVSVFTVSMVKADSDKVPFPADYKDTFTNYLSLDRTQNPDQIIRLFANDEALKGVDADGKFSYGSVLLAEIYTTKKDTEGKVLESSLGRRIRDKLALIAIMQRGEGFGKDIPEGLKNGDWDFATYKPDGTVAEKDLNSCRGCHAPLVNVNHVFSFDHIQ